MKTQGKELVLLIEDLATAQLVEFMLEALIVRASERNDLCKLRWAAAATTGFYQKTSEAIRQRTELLLHMDRSSTEEGYTSESEFLIELQQYLCTCRHRCWIYLW